MQRNEDIICAVITPPGVGAISVIRVSGRGAIDLCSKIFEGRHNLSASPAGRIHYGKIKGSVDDVLASVFRAPNSYTGEDSVEISCHGNPVIASRIVKMLIENGARTAEPGEFTKRAFLNGKMDLLQAEAVAEIIKSRSDAALRGARNQLDGYLSAHLKKIKDDLISVTGLIELELDFSEEDLEFVDKHGLKDKVKTIIEEINKLINSFSTGRKIFDGINVAIIGRPNAGKSSLLNTLLKEDRAIVSEIPGTTRDIIREELIIDGICFRLFDTAGLRRSSDSIEEEGVRRAMKIIEEVDIILHIVDASSPVNDKSEEPDIPADKHTIHVLNKIDIATGEVLNSERFRDYIKICAITGVGMDKLIEQLRKYSDTQGVYTENTAIISNLRQRDCLMRAAASLKNVLASLENNMSGEFVAVDMRKAIDALKELIGEVTTEDIMNAIFSKFCIGK